MLRYLHLRKLLIVAVLAAFAFTLVAPVAAQGFNASIVNASRVNLRSGPGAGFGVVTVLSFGQQLILLSRNADNSWVQVQTANGTVGWVNARYVQTAVPVETVAQTAPTGALSAVVTASFLNVRNGPGANFTPVARLSYGQTMNLLARNADASWVQMNIPGVVEGWVSARYVSASVLIGNLPVSSQTGTFPSFQQPVPTGGQTGIITALNLNVRYGPAIWHGIFARLSQGEGVSLIGRNGDASWLLVQLADGRTGWVNRGFVSTTYPVASLPLRG